MGLCHRYRAFLTNINTRQRTKTNLCHIVMRREEGKGLIEVCSTSSPWLTLQLSHFLPWIEVSDNYGEKSEMLFKLKPLPSMKIKLKKSRYLVNNKYMDMSIEIS